MCCSPPKITKLRPHLVTHILRRQLTVTQELTAFIFFGFFNVLIVSSLTFSTNESIHFPLKTEEEVERKLDFLPFSSSSSSCSSPLHRQHNQSVHHSSPLLSQTDPKSGPDISTMAPTFSVGFEKMIIDRSFTLSLSFHLFLAGLRKRTEKLESGETWVREGSEGKLSLPPKKN